MRTGGWFASGGRMSYIPLALVREPRGGVVGSRFLSKKKAVSFATKNTKTSIRVTSWMK